MSKLLGGLRHFVLLVARLALGGVMLLHAYHRWTDGVPQQAAYLAQFGLPYAEVFAWAALIGEALAGLLLIIGLFTPLAAAGVVAEQVVIICWISWRYGPFVGDHGWEYQAILAVLALVLVVHGGGAVALDRLFRRTKRRDTDVDDASAP